MVIKVGDKEYKDTPEDLQLARAEAVRVEKSVKFYDRTHIEEIPQESKKVYISRGNGIASRGIYTRRNS